MIGWRLAALCASDQAARAAALQASGARRNSSLVMVNRVTLRIACRSSGKVIRA